MAKCKCCHIKGFTVETDVNGLCSACAPYYYLTMPDDLKALAQTLQAMDRIGRAEAALARLGTARECLNRLRPYVVAGLARLPRQPIDLDQYLDRLEGQWQQTLREEA